MSRVRIRCVGAPPVVAHGFRVEHPATFHDLAVAIVDDDGTEHPVTNVRSVAFGVRAGEMATAAIEFFDVDVDVIAELPDPGRITCDPDVCGGVPCVRGLRIPVAVVLRHLDAGKSAADIAAELPELDAEDVAACIAYAERVGP